MHYFSLLLCLIGVLVTLNLDIVTIGICAGWWSPLLLLWDASMGLTLVGVWLLCIVAGIGEEEKEEEWWWYE